jgi:hypothetical protein
MVQKVLIVEDNSFWQEDIEMFCQEVLAEIHRDEALKELYLDVVFEGDQNSQVEIVSSLEEALAFIQKIPDEQGHEILLKKDYYGLITIDINLDDVNPDNTEGWVLIDQLRKKDKAVEVIVISGQNTPTYSKASVEKYGALTFVWKGDFPQDKEFKNLMKSAILHGDAIRLLHTEQWFYVKLAALIGEYIQGIELEYSPKYRVNIADQFSNRVDSLTRIPNVDWSRSVIRSLNHRNNWGLLSITINGLEKFASLLYGSQHANEVKQFVAQILDTTLAQYGNREDFIGHDDSGFILISSPDKLDQLQNVIETRFLQEIVIFYQYEDQQRGYAVLDINGQTQNISFMSLLISRVTAYDGPFYDYLDITELASKRKRTLVQ